MTGLVRTTIDTPVGELTLVASDAGLRAIHFDAERWPAVGGRSAGEVVGEPIGIGDDDMMRDAVAQIDAYFAGQLRRFELRLDLGGLTGFQAEVCRELQAVPYGDLVSYGQLARNLGSPDASRAVGSACNRNRLPIVVPCHRVVAADGSLGGYAAGLEVKRGLLARERGSALPAGGWEPASLKGVPVQATLDL